MYHIQSSEIFYYPGVRSHVWDSYTPDQYEKTLLSKHGHRNFLKATFYFMLPLRGLVYKIFLRLPSVAFSVRAQIKKLIINSISNNIHYVFTFQSD